MTLVTAKNQHRCWKARVHTRTHEKTKWDYFVRLRLRFLYIDKIKCHFFAIFSLFEGVSTHIHIGCREKQHLNYISTFTAKANPIYKTKNGLKN